MRVCEYVWRVSAYHDGELSPEDARGLEAHLAQCAICTQELKELRGLSQLLGQAPVPEAPPKLIERLHQTVASAREVAVITLAKRLTAAAAAILIVCAAWSLGLFGSGKSSETANSWELAAVTLLPDASSTDTQQLAQWIVDDLSSEKRHD